MVLRRQTDLMHYVLLCTLTTGFRFCTQRQDSIGTHNVLAHTMRNSTLSLILVTNCAHTGVHLLDHDTEGTQR